jgi:hypothetical protein
MTRQRSQASTSDPPSRPARHGPDTTASDTRYPRPAADQEDTKRSSIGVSMALGTALGLTFGAAFDNVALGLALGISLGLAFGAGADARK